MERTSEPDRALVEAIERELHAAALRIVDLMDRERRHQAQPATEARCTCESPTCPRPHGPSAAAQERLAELARRSGRYSGRADG